MQSPCALLERICFYCRKCGGGHFPLDRALDLGGKSAAPGAESLYADAASSDSYEEAVRKLGNLAGMTVSKATLQRHSTRIGEEMRAFEREDAEASPPAKRVLLEIDDTEVPMAAREVEGVAGKQADGAAKTSEAKAVVCRVADSLDPKTGEPRTDRNSGAAGVRTDSAQAVNGAGRASPPAWSSSCTGTACSRPRKWLCCPMGRRGSGPFARRSCPDGKRPSSSTCATPSNMRPTPCRPRRRTRASGRRGWRGSGSSWMPGGSTGPSPP